jgi:peptidoglycan/LPS O-acetylase OafA/YrhL
MRYIPALDGMRGVSLPGTILTHYALFYAFSKSAPHWLTHVGPLTLNIQMFFVLSGALITSLLVAEHQRSGDVSLKSFYLRRSRRLGPALIVTLLAIGIIEAVWPGSRASSPLGHHPWLAFGAVAVFAGNWVLFTYSGGLGWLGPAWTLGIEEQFYLTWPVLLRRLLRRNVKRRTVIVLLAVVVGASLVGGSLLQAHAGKWRTIYATPVQLPSILFGCALGYELTANRDGRLARLMRSPLVAVLGLAGMVVTSIELVRHPAPLYVGGYAIYAAFACLLIGHCFVRAGEETLATRVFGWRPFVVIGQVSYEAYLVHVIVIIGLARAMPSVHVYPMMAIDTVVVAVVSAILYYTVEQPIRRRGWKSAFARGGAPGRLRPALASAGTRRAVLAGGLAGVVALTGLGVVSARTAGGAGPVAVAAEAPDHPASLVTATPPGKGRHHSGGTASAPDRATAGGRGRAGGSDAHPGGAVGCRSATCETSARAGLPVITHLLPATGAVAGGTPLTIYGANFTKHAEVFFNGVRLEQVHRVNNSTLQVLTPPAKLVALDLGLTALTNLKDLQAAVTVRTAAGVSSVGVGDRFTYL